MAEVQRFLRSRHPQHRVYNLCKEDDRRRRKMKDCRFHAGDFVNFKESCCFLFWMMVLDEGIPIH